jgi:hypothetical protein
MTAVEWLQDQFRKDNLSKEFAKVFNSSFEQAKEMEKQQIIESYETDMSSCGEFRNGLDYYNEKFNKDENK